MKYIVTGASGLIGSAVVWALNQRGETDILAVDHLGTSEKWRNLRALHYADYLEKEDFLKRLSSGTFGSGTQAIVHLGACSATTEKDASYLISNNFAYTRELASFAVSHGIQFLYASSAATYGGGEQGYVDDVGSIEKLRPLNMYGYSKQMFDLWAKCKGLFSSIAGMKFTNVFGPNELHKGEMRSVVLRAYEQICSTGTVKLFQSHHPDYADGEFKRDFLYVKDAVDMLLFILDHRLSGLYNIGSGRAETWNSLANAVFSAMGREPRIEYIPMPESLRAKYQYYTCAAMERLHAAGYRKEARPLKESIRDYVQYYLMQNKFLGD